MYKLEDLEQAEHHLQEAIRAGTNNYRDTLNVHVDSYYQLARLLAEKVDPPRYAEAVIPLERAVKLWPQHRPTRILLALCLPPERKTDANEHLAVAERLLVSKRR